jgi:hypothetical protein
LSGNVFTALLGIERHSQTSSFRWKIKIMTTPTEDQLSIGDAANAPRRATIGGETIEEHSLPDRIAYEKFAGGQVNAANPERAIRRVQFRHARPGT